MLKKDEPWGSVCLSKGALSAVCVIEGGTKGSSQLVAMWCDTSGHEEQCPNPKHNTSYFGVGIEVAYTCP